MHRVSDTTVSFTIHVKKDLLVGLDFSEAEMEEIDNPKTAKHVLMTKMVDEMWDKFRIPATNILKSYKSDFESKS